MPYSGLLPSLAAIRQACKEPLDAAPRDQKGFAVYIFERARAIEAAWEMRGNVATATALRTSVFHGSPPPSAS